MAKRSEEAPRTFGELRRLLDGLGNPWRPDPSRSDDEQLPAYPTGGDGTYDSLGLVRSEAEVLDLLRSRPSRHPDLRDDWVEHGLLEDVAADESVPVKGRAKKPGGARTPTPAPDMGG